MTDYTIPRANAPIAGQEAPTIQWYNYLRGIGASTADSNAALLADITIISDKLGSPDGTPENIPPLGNITGINGNASVTVTGANIKQVQLVNDMTVASPVSFYGTNASGIKGWNLIGSAFADSANIVKTVTAGVVSFDLTTISGTVGGTLSKWGFDAYGRRVSGDNASTSDLPEGSRLYFTTQRAQDAAGALATNSATINLVYDGTLHTLTATLNNTAVTPGSYGDATHVSTFTVDAQGRLTLAGSTAITFPPGGVTSVFGRTGTVVAVSGDYTAAQVTGAVATTRTISTTAPLTGGGDLSANRTFAIPVATTSVDGYISASDWTTFNGKLSDAPNNGNTYARKNALWQAIVATLVGSTSFQIGNILVQTGSDSAPIPSSSTATTKAVVFPTTYGTTLWVGVSPTTAGVTSSGYNAVPAISTKLTTGFTVTLDAEGGGGNNINKIINFDWMAIGVVSSSGTLVITGAYPSATNGVPYSQALAISGGIAPYSLTGGTGLASGTLPAGLALSISGSTLVLSGTPTTNATYTFTVSVTSSDLQIATSPQSIVVSATALPPISGYDLWFDASQLTYSNGATVTTWNDLGPSHLASTAVGTAIMRTTGMGGHPAVEMTAGAAFTYVFSPTGDTAGTVLAVWRNLNLTPTSGNASAHPIGFASSTPASLFPFTDGKIYDGTLSTSRPATTAPTSFPYTSPFSYARASNASTTKIWLAGSVLVTSSDAYAVMPRVNIGRSNTDATFFANCQVSEILYYRSRVSDADIATTLAYFHTKWGT